MRRGRPGHTAVTVPRRSRYNWNGHRVKLATSTATVNPISTCAARYDHSAISRGSISFPGRERVFGRKERDGIDCIKLRSSTCHVLYRLAVALHRTSLWITLRNFARFWLNPGEILLIVLSSGGIYYFTTKIISDYERSFGILPSFFSNLVKC